MVNTSWMGLRIVNQQTFRFGCGKQFLVGRNEDYR